MNFPRLKDFKKATGKSLNEIAASTGVGVSHLSRILSGKITPKGDVRLVLEDYFKTCKQPLVTKALVVKEQRLRIAIAEPEFVEPHFIPELGEKGVYDYDIAKSLGVEVSRIREKIQRSDMINDLNENAKVVKLLLATASKNANFAFNLKAAKFFVAKYDNKIGNGYLDYLLDCEKSVDKTLQAQVDVFNEYRANPLIALQIQIMEAHKESVKQASQNLERFVGVDKRIDYLEGEIKKFDCASGYTSVRAFCILHKIFPTDNRTLAQHGRALVSLHRVRGIPLAPKIPNEAFGEVGVYPISLMEEYFTEIGKMNVEDWDADYEWQRGHL